MGFIIYYLVLLVNPMGRILVRWNRFRNNLEMLRHSICNWLYPSRSHITHNEHITNAIIQMSRTVGEPGV